MLTPMEIGDLLDLEKEATYPCSDGSTISCISVDALADAAFEKGKTESELKFNPDYLDFQKGVGVGRMMERVKISTDLISRADAGLDALPKVYSEFWKGYWQGRKEAGQSLKESK